MSINLIDTAEQPTPEQLTRRGLQQEFDDAQSDIGVYLDLSSL